MNNEERQLIIKSIEHWEKDVITYLYNNDTFNPYDYHVEWIKSGDSVLISNKHCPLCQKYLKTFDNIIYHCLGCLWLEHSGHKCYDEEYLDFTHEPELFTGKSVVNKLWSIGLQDHSDKHFTDYKYYSYN